MCVHVYIEDLWCANVCYLYCISMCIYIYIHLVHTKDLLDLYIVSLYMYIISHMLHVWNIYPHLPEQNHQNVPECMLKYTMHGASGYIVLVLVMWVKKNAIHP